MDVISHALVGDIIQRSRPIRCTAKWAIIIAAIIPDLPTGFVYLLLGREKSRMFWIPFNSDWVGIRETHPLWSAMWEVPHTIFFLLLIVVPIVILARWPKSIIIAYASHILLDLPTHTGEWAMKPFFPLQMTVNGFTDAWAWPINYMIISWCLLVIIDYAANRIRDRLDHSTTTKER